MQPQQPARQQEPEITWTVPLERANMILSILAKQPFEIISPVMDDLRQQAQSQIQRLQQLGMAGGPPNGQMGEREAAPLPS